MRNISFSLTTPQFIAGTKDVTRRVGWEHAKAGDEMKAVEKAMGLKAGESMVIIGCIKIISVRREPLRRLLDDLDYGFAETVREGFPEGHPCHWPSKFVDFFCRTHSGCFPEREITRLEFVKL